jgi:uncharacterized protein YdgA (DUF945 family)
MRKFVSAMLALIVIIVFSPWITGIWFEKSYHNIISFYNAEGDVAIQILKYHRGWWKSEATLNVKIMNPNVRLFWEGSHVKHPEFNFTVDQEIQHGPILYYDTKELPVFFGLASVHEILHLS